MNGPQKIEERQISPLLRLAIANGVSSSVEHLILRGLDVNACDEKGRTALIIACAKGHLEICALLLRHEANPAIKDHEGNCAFMTAIQNGHDNIAALIQPMPQPTSSMLEVENFPVAVATVEYEFLDFNAWEEDIETPTPANDITCAAEAEILQSGIASHIPIDIDEDWSDVEISLPEIVRATRDPLLEDEEKWLPSFRLLIAEGMRESILNNEQIAAALDYGLDKGEIDVNWETKLRVVIEDMGIVVRDTLTTTEDASDFFSDDLLDTRVDESVEYFRSLIIDEFSAFNLYLNQIAKKTMLSREDEQRIGRDIEEGKKAVVAAILLSPLALQKLMGALEKVASGEIQMADITNEEAVPSSAEAGDIEEEAYNLDAESEGVNLASTANQAKLNEIKALYEMKASADLLNAIYRLNLTESFIVSLQGAVTEDTAVPEALMMLKSGISRMRKAKRKLVESNLRLSVWLAKKFNGLPFMDLVQEGNIGLMKAAERFDYRRGAKFSTYAVFWIRQSIMRSMSDQALTIRVPVHVNDDMRKVKRSIENSYPFTAQGPSDEVLSVTHSIPVARVKKIRDIPDEPLSMEDLVEQGFSASEDLPDDFYTPEEITITRSLQRTVRAALKTLSERERDVIRMRFGIDEYEEHTLEEVGQKYKVTRERIRQLEANAIRKLKHPSRSRVLKPFLEGHT